MATLGHTLKKRAADILTYFDHPGTSNGPSEAINGRLEHLRGIALGFRNLTHYCGSPQIVEGLRLRGVRDGRRGGLLVIDR